MRTNAKRPRFGDELDAKAIKRTMARRDWLLAKEKWLTSDDVAVRAHGTAVNPTKDQFAYQLRQSRQLLGVLHERRRLHPAFQFETVDGRLKALPIMKALLEILPADETGWTQTFWLFQPTGRLDGKRPADVLQQRPDDVINAARKDFHGDEGI